MLLYVAVLVFSCSKEEDEPMDNSIALNETSVEIDYEGQFKLDASFNREGYSPSDFVWESDNEEIVSVGNDGNLTGERAGTANVTVSTSDGAFSTTCEVIVNPTNFLFQEPMLDFGGNMSSVKLYEERELAAEIDDALLYNGENGNVRNVMYMFENGSYNGSVVMLANTEYAAEEAFLFMEQRYEYGGNSDGVHLFMNDAVAVGISVNAEFGLNAFYLKNDFGENSRANIIGQMNEIIENIKKEGF